MNFGCPELVHYGLRELSLQQHVVNPPVCPPVVAGAPRHQGVVLEAGVVGLLVEQVDQSQALYRALVLGWEAESRPLIGPDI